MRSDWVPICCDIPALGEGQGGDQFYWTTIIIKSRCLWTGLEQALFLLVEGGELRDWETMNIPGKKYSTVTPGEFLKLLPTMSR